MKDKTIPMIGRRFGRLTVVAKGENPTSSRVAYWICKCDCGNITKPISGTKLRCGETKSCGCYKNELLIERSTRHGLVHTRIHTIWSQMKDRCYNPHSSSYNHYGGRGITICDEWRNNLESFYKWAMENGYTEDLSIDRIDVNGNYSPENCRWANNKLQCNNKRNNIVVEINGVSKTIAQWAEESGNKYRTVHARFNRGWTGADLIRKV